MTLSRALVTMAVAALALTGCTPHYAETPPVPPATSSSAVPTVEPSPEPTSSVPVPPPVTSTPAPPPPAPVARCVAPAGMAALLDQDKSDSQRPWKRPAGVEKTPIYLDASRVKNNAEWMGYLNGAAAKWNVSPCVDVRIVETCPTGVKCVTFELRANDDGNFDAIERNGYTTGGHITVDPALKGAPLPRCSERYNVTIHEIGHAIGLVHRMKRKALMESPTYGDVCDIDDVDLKNLAFSYTVMQK